MIKIVDGDILKTDCNIICHQVNCRGVMGAGLAKQIRDTYPKCYEEYSEFVADFKHVGLLGQVYYYVDDSGKVIANLFGQDGYGRSKKQTDYEALEEAFKYVREAVTEDGSEFKGYSIAIPYMIGCGLAGGDWNIVYSMIQDIFKDIDVTLYKFKR